MEQITENSKSEYGKFRKFKTSSGKLILAGRNAEENEKLIKQVSEGEIVLHTKAPGSPFVNIKGIASKKDIYEAGVFCAKYSQAWKKAKIKKDIPVHWFRSKDIFKSENMKPGTFGVKRFKEIKVKREDIKKFGK